MLCPKISTFRVVHGSRVTSGIVSVAFMYSVCVLGSPGALVHLGHWFTWCTSALVHLGHWFTWCTSLPGAPVHLGHRFTWGTGAPRALVHGSPGALVQWFTWCNGSPGALHLRYSMTKHLCCPHYGLWRLQHCKQDSVWLPVT